MDQCSINKLYSVPSTTLLNPREQQTFGCPGYIAKGMPANDKSARIGAAISKRAGLELESRTGREDVSPKKYLPQIRTSNRLKAASESFS